MEPDRDRKPQDSHGSQGQIAGIGCTLPFSGTVLLGLILALSVIIARNDDLRHSPLWAIPAALAVALVLLFTRVQRYKGPKE